MTTTVAPMKTTRQRTYARQASLVLTAAFALSAAYTTYTWFAGLSDPDFTVTTPTAWVFYALGFAACWLVRTDRPWAAGTIAAYLSALIGVAVFYYPTTFTPAQQTWLGWFENDVYTSLLVVALYLVVQRLRRVVLR